MQNIEHLVWKEKERTTIADCRIFKAIEALMQDPNGRTAKFYMLDAPDWINIIPLFRDEHNREMCILARQYRYGSAAVTLEFPAGTVEAGEAPLNTALRELREETGFISDDVIHLGSISPNPAFLNNKVHTFLARDCRKAHDQELDEHEILDIIVKPLDEVLRNLGTGRYDNGTTLIAAYFLRQWQDKQNRD